MKINDKGDTDFDQGAIVPSRPLGAGERSDRGPRRHAGQGSQAEAGHGQHAAAGNHQGGGAKLTASSRPRASRRRPRCSPRPPWRARSTTWSGLKENVILGHLVPAGTGFHTYQDRGPHPPGGARSPAPRRKTSWPGISPSWTPRTRNSRPRPWPPPATAATASRPPPAQTAGPSLDSLFLGYAGGDDDSDSDGDGDDEE